MDKNDEILRLYEIYNDSKEKFIDRSFATNKFYLIVEIVLLSISIAIGGTPYDVLNIVLPLIGMLIALMWWLNQDSYGFMIKIKYKNVFTLLEQSLAASPITDETKAIEEAARSKSGFVFNNAHKLLAVVMLVIFFILFLAAFIPYIMILFSTSG